MPQGKVKWFNTKPEYIWLEDEEVEDLYESAIAQDAVDEGRVE